MGQEQRLLDESSNPPGGTSAVRVLFSSGDPRFAGSNSAEVD
jgi:hypothetical protein